MATIDDFGGTTDPLNAPPLGGPTGWAAAVRDAIAALQGFVSGGRLITPGLVLENNDPLGAEYAGSIWTRAANNRASVRDFDTSNLTQLQVATPTDAHDATTKAYVDGVSSVDDVVTNAPNFPIRSQWSKRAVTPQGIASVAFRIECDGAVTGQITISLRDINRGPATLVPAFAVDAGNQYLLLWGALGSNSHDMTVWVIGAPPGSWAPTSPTAPHTWKAGDELNVALTYLTDVPS